MILKEIKLKNIRSYESQTIKFDEGSVLLSGDIGSGKSSILLSIEFALFGIMPGMLNGESLLRHGEEFGEVELVFKIEDKEVIIHRELKRINKGVVHSSGFIVINGVKTSGTTIELKAKIFDLLGYPIEDLRKSKSLVYRYTVYTPQEEMKAIIREDADTRLSILRKIFGVDKYKRALENNVLVVRKLKRLKENYEIQCSGITDLKNKLEEKLKEKVEFNNEINKIDEEIVLINKKSIEKKQELTNIAEKIEKLNSLRAELKSLGALNNEKINIISEKENEVNSLKKELDEINSKISSFSMSIEEIDKIKEKIKELEKKEEQFNIINKEISNLKIKKAQLMSEISSNNVDRISEEIFNLKNKLDSLKGLQKEYFKLADEVENIKKIEEEIEILKRDKRDVEKQKIELQAKIDSEKEIIKRIIEQDKCPTCLQEITEEYKGDISEKKTKNIDKYKDKLDSLNILIKNMQKEVDDRLVIVSELKIKKERVIEIKTQIKNIEEIQQEIERLNKEKEKRTKKIENIKEQIDFISESITKKEKEMNSLGFDYEENKKTLERLREVIVLKDKAFEKQKNIYSVSNKIESLKNEQKDIIKKIYETKEKITFFGDVLKIKEKIDGELEELNKSLKEKEIIKSTITEKINSLKEWIEDYKNKIKQKQEYSKKAKRLGEMIYWLEKNFVGVVSLIEKTVLRRIRFEFDSLLTEWFNMLVPDENLSIKINEEFTPILIQNGYEVDVGNLSGGEKTAVALAYRLSLNKVINDVVSSIKTKELIILDEPTDGFSSEQLDRVRAVLDELGMKQIIIVSHEKKIESFVDSIINVEKNEGVSNTN